MEMRTIDYMLDGDTFVGRYRVTNHKHGPTISVQFERHALSARLHGNNEELLARSLLSELVRAKVAAETPSHSRAA